MPDEKLLLTITEVAESLRLGKSTVRVLLKRGDIASIRIGGAVRILRSDLDDFIALSRRTGE
jgi:excisionase family DNA binding protein